MSKFRSIASLMNSLKYRWYKRSVSYKNLADLKYEIKFGKKINWKSPEDLNQWINWIAFNTDTSQWVRLADKYAVREYISENGFGDTLIPLLDRWTDPSEISFDALPEKFVLKINNGSGDVRIIRNKKAENIDNIRSYFKRIFKHQFGKDTAEPHYLKIKPCIVAEELLDSSKQTQASDSLIDYKFWCFNGNPVCCFVVSNRTKEFFSVDLYTADEKWERIDKGNIIYNDQHLRASAPMPKPKRLNEMLDIVKTLSKGLPQVRVDLYEVEDKVYFGEMTMTSLGGRMDYFSEKYLKVLGDHCKQALEKLGMWK